MSDVRSRLESKELQRKEAATRQTADPERVNLMIEKLRLRGFSETEIAEGLAELRDHNVEVTPTTLFNEVMYGSFVENE